MEKATLETDQKEMPWNEPIDRHDEPCRRIKRVITAVGRIKYTRSGIGPLSTDSLQVDGMLVVEE